MREIRTTKNRHDCANDGTCGKFIQSCKISDSDISFFDGSGKLITKVPKLPKYSGDKYVNQLYKEAESKQFHYPPTDIQNVLPNSLTVKHGYINCTVKYDSLSEQEKNQIETDIKNAYEAFKEKFCLENSNASYDITVYIFNNRSDYTKYNNLLNIDEDGGPGYIIRGVTDYHNILTYKQDSMDAVLGHELGHIFQLRFSPAGAVRSLNWIDTEFIANVIGQEAEEKNYRAICKWLGVDEYSNYGPSGFKFKYKGTTGIVYRKNLSEEEKFQIIQRVKNSGLDRYEDSEWGGIRFKYQNTTGIIHRRNLSEEKKFQIIQDIKSSYKLLTSECDGLGNDSTTLSIRLDEKNNIDGMYFYNLNKNIRKQLDKTFISRSKPEEEVNEVQHTGTREPTEHQPVLPSPKMINVGRSKPEEEVNEVKHTGTGEPTKHQPVLPNSKIINVEGTNFKLKVHYDQIDEKDLLMIEKYVNYIFNAYKERHALDVNANTVLESYIYNNLEDYHNAHPWTRSVAGGHAQGLNQYVPHKGSHFIGELLAHEICHSLNHYNQQNHGIPRPSCGYVGHDDASHFGWDLRKELDAIKLGNSQKESNTGKSQESNEVNSGSEKGKPQSQEELNKVKYTGSKEEQSKVEESQQDTQQSVIFQALDYIIGSISSFFSWLFGSKEKEQPTQQSDDNLSLLKFDVSELDHDVGDHLSDNHNHYHSSDDLI
ncbi:hypothetical protein [Wolbachia pipientis]|uniref:hypothetical protein n=1 Tax=Wolbachia pipientis TaxID=955 RepID=UPI00202F3007|nr:hypothetical protein [Wolbachia pipientis]MCM1002359.1 hypothetical protein [Wolbachia pipientis]